MSEVTAENEANVENEVTEESKVTAENEVIAENEVPDEAAGATDEPDLSTGEVQPEPEEKISTRGDDRASISDVTTDRSNQNVAIDAEPVEKPEEEVEVPTEETTEEQPVPAERTQTEDGEPIVSDVSASGEEATTTDDTETQEPKSKEPSPSQEGEMEAVFQLIEAEEPTHVEAHTRYTMIEETLMDDLGKQFTVKQKVPIIRETHKFEKVSLPGDTEEQKTHKFLETITRVVKESVMNEEGTLEEKEKEITQVVEHLTRPTSVTIFAKRKNEKGEIEEYVVPPDETPPPPPPPPKVPEHIEKETKVKRISRAKPPPQKKKILKMVPQEEAVPCFPGKSQMILKPKVEEIEVEVDDLDIDIEDLEILLETEDMSEEDQARLREDMQIKIDAKIGRLKDNLRTVLVRLALAEKKRNLYMQLISISSEVKENILNPPDPDKPTFKVPKKGRSEDKFRRMYEDKLAEYRDLRSVILMKLATEKKRKEEVKEKYDLIGTEVAQLKKQLEDKLHNSIPKLHPRNDPIFDKQSPQGMVNRLLELTERLDNETKELMYKKKQMYLAKQKYDQITDNEQGLNYRHAMASKELKLLLAKNDRRNEKLEAVKVTMQKESMAVTHINQKCEAVLKTTDEKISVLQNLNRSLNRARQDRKDVHQARRKVEAELRKEKAKIQVKNHPSLLKEYYMVQDLLKMKQAEFHDLKRHCLSSLQQLARSEDL